MKNYKYIIGIDEVGRGPIAGPVVVGAFCVAAADSEKVFKELSGITDSKKISEKKREAYALKMKNLKEFGLISIAISGVSAKKIDTHGIVFAINAALKSCLQKLQLDPREVFIYLDGGLRAPEEFNQETVVKGDSKIWQIGAASVAAKVARDQMMVDFGNKYPGYGFEKHKGYATQFHRESIKKRGTTDIHRISWIKA